MGLFNGRLRTRPGRPEARVGPRGRGRHDVPARFEAVGEALASVGGPDVRAERAVAACSVLGRDLAADGVPLDEALDGLRDTARWVTGEPPSYAAVRALASGWSEATLGYLHQLSCEDPLTGLASLPHLRSRLAELYRDQEATGEPVGDRQVLVVLDVPGRRLDGEVFGAALRTARLAETARTAFPGGHTLARVRPERLALLVTRDHRLPRRLALLRTMLGGVSPPVRLWLESLPGDDRAAAALLDELARR